MTTYRMFDDNIMGAVEKAKANDKPIDTHTAREITAGILLLLWRNKIRPPRDLALFAQNGSFTRAMFRNAIGTARGLVDFGDQTSALDALCRHVDMVAGPLDNDIRGRLPVPDWKPVV